ncbi:MAG TPA: hypothetical protein DD381_04455 [Lentisphaeria bacterium]|nr:MAG: hypothetical protein A2X47_07195 [Lentisphaerae bacterium GWF2_38_69]HBM15584.1 hypothetical protein [Lentisphaeria bacterium]
MNQTDREIFFLWNDDKHSPAFNMALDEELLNESVRLNSCILRFYEWEAKAMSIGYIQNFSQTCKEGYELIRRPTGGGVVFHDIDFTYTVIIPSGHRIEKMSREESYYIIHKIIIKALDSIGLAAQLVSGSTVAKDKMSMQCFTAPVKFDISSRNGDGNSKIAGAAQRRTKLGILHQGSIVLENIENIKASIKNNIIKAFETELNVRFEKFKPEHDFLLRAEELADNKYSKNSWNKMR